MKVERRISASFKDVPGGQILGATTDFTHRLLDSDISIQDWLRGFQEENHSTEYENGMDVLNSLPKDLDYLKK